MNATKQDLFDILNCMQEAVLAASLYVNDKLEHVRSLVEEEE